jgi:hypothetical protein
MQGHSIIPSPVPIHLPVQTHPVTQHGDGPNSGRFTQIWYRWAQAMTTFMGNGQGTNVPATSVVAFMALRRS